MLKDLPKEALTKPTDPLLAVLARFEGIDTEQLAEGVYQAHLNWDHQISSYLFASRAFFDPVLDKHDIPEYGVCDGWEQILEQNPKLATIPEKYIIHVTPIVRDQSNAGQGGGWRWHKWGEYIGAHEPQCEYLDDEPDIDKVFVFHVRRIY